MNIKRCDECEIEKVLELQKKFFNENCCNGICLDTKEKLANEIGFIIEENGEVVGHFENGTVKKDRGVFKCLY